MGLLAFLRPSQLIRRKAIWSGLLGNSTPWRIVAVVMLTREAVRWLSGSGSETIDVASFGSGRSMEIVTSKPLSRKQAKRLVKRGKLMPLKEQRAEATLWATERVEATARGSRRRRGK